MIRHRRSLFALMFASWGALTYGTETSSVLDVLELRCGKCHGAEVRKADLDLSSFDGIARGGESGDPLISNSLEDSHLWQVIESEEMPPEDEPQLSPSQREILRKWIESRTHASQPSERLNQHDVLPILLLRCTTCHGPQRQDGGLDLRTPESMLVGGKGGPAIKPGDPAGSLLIQRIQSQQCPPRELLLKFFIRRPSKSELATLSQWILQGAPVENIQPDVATASPDPLVHDDDRSHWAFRPPKPIAQGGVDYFIRQRLKGSGLSPSRPADRATLIRRATLDLTGIPASRTQWERWMANEQPSWYEQMLDELLASPNYGQRWGRYWLDLAGYADSEGGTSADPIRKVAYKYRDYVVRSFNEDKPYDRFLLEQLAGDELVDYENADTITQEMVDCLIATGFLRMGIDETGSRTMNFVPERLNVIDDAISVVGSSIMGLSLGCARCHSHKYDPIPHRDYYRVKAVFQGAFDEHDWMSFKTRTLSVATASHRQAVQRTNPPIERIIKKLQATQKALYLKYQMRLLEHHYPSQSAEDNQATLAALRIADNNRRLPQKRLVERLRTVELIPLDKQPEAIAQIQREINETQREIDRQTRRLVPALQIRALWDQGRPSPTYILRRGEHNRPGPLVGPGVPSVLTDGKTPMDVNAPFPGSPKTGRRLAFVQWLTRPDNPLTARVMVNRIWYHHFGRGLVSSLDNFGVQAEPPTHPQLLDWLAQEFVNKSWSIKHIHRLIMTSQTYRQHSGVSEVNGGIDPENRLLAHMPLRRLDAESLRDSMLSIAGQLDFAQGGYPDPVTIGPDGSVRINPIAEDGWRRSIYAQYRRTEIPTMLDVFDYPQMGPNCIQRDASTVSPQSLLLWNNQHVRLLAGKFADRIRNLSTGASARQQIESIYQLALNRNPSAKELQVSVRGLDELTAAYHGDRDAALTTFCHSIFNSAAFLFVD